MICVFSLMQKCMQRVKDERDTAINEKNIWIYAFSMCYELNWIDDAFINYASIFILSNKRWNRWCYVIHQWNDSSILLGMCICVNMTTNIQLHIKYCLIFLFIALFFFLTTKCLIVCQIKKNGSNKCKNENNWLRISEFR